MRSFKTRRITDPSSKIWRSQHASVDKIQKQLREIGVADTTICKHLRHLKASLRWAKSMGFLVRVPEFHMPKAGRHQAVMKGRPITDEEFQRMLDSVESVVGEKAADSWKFLLRGFWYSGLRLGEALNLTWHPSDRLFVDFEGKYPMFRICAAFEKGRRDRVLAMTPDFAELLQKHGVLSSGSVFGPIGIERNQRCEQNNWVSIIGSRIGKAANIVVSNGDKKKYASIHDLRRSFGFRWSRKVMPQVLKELMRHESIDTTLRFYVGQDAEKIAEEIWK